jgi:Domain of unknown function (DUF6471)
MRRPTRSPFHRPAIQTLERLHSELAGQILQNKQEAQQLAGQMLHVEAVIKMLDPTFNLRRIAVKRRQAEWAERASTFLKQKLKESEVTYVELAKRLKKHGFAETEASITNKLKRGTFSATFFLACLAAMELEGVVLEEI